MITSLSNSKIKTIRKLKDRKARESAGLFFVEGVRIVGEALEENWQINQAIIAPELIRDGYSQELVQKLYSNDVDILEVSSQVFQSLSLKEGPKGIAAVIQQKWADPNLLLQKPGLFVALDRIQDHGNLGTIMRTADAVGVNGIYLLDESTDPFDIATIRASMGAIFNMPVIRMTSQKFVKLVQDNDIFLVGTSDRGAVDYQTINYPQKMVLLMGSEREGLTDSLMDACSALVYLPMIGKSDSLNLAIATGVSLYEIYNQFRKKEGL
ncbi:MAG: rRNA methyltransferase [Anaerolineaceae bacterium]|nr:rRNA methyltransferase [Anaerolineaceae bacterium]